MNIQTFAKARPLIHAALIAVGLTAAACSDDGYGSGYSSTPNNQNSNGYDPAVAIVSPAKNGSVSGASLLLKLKTTYFTIIAPGGALKDGEGHIHVYLDKPASSPAYDAVIKQGTSDAEATVPMPTTPGTHYLIVSLQKNDHSPYGIQDSVAFTVAAPGSASNGGNGGYDNGYGDYGSY
jgi:hypothetical protein